MITSLRLVFWGPLFVKSWQNLPLVAIAVAFTISSFSGGYHWSRSFLRLPVSWRLTNLSVPVNESSGGLDLRVLCAFCVLAMIVLWDSVNMIDNHLCWTPGFSAFQPHTKRKQKQAMIEIWSESTGAEWNNQHSSIDPRQRPPVRKWSTHVQYSEVGGSSKLNEYHYLWGSLFSPNTVCG